MENKKQDSLTEFRHFMEDIYPRMTNEDFLETRNTDNFGATINVIKKRIELEIEIESL